MLKWYEENGNESDVVISSRVRLARNLDKYPFSTRLSDEEAIKLVQTVHQSMTVLGNETDGCYYQCSFNRLADIDKLAMVERHIVSPALAVKKQETGVILSEDESVSIMVNEEDHIRIQAVTCGMNMPQVWKVASRIDDMTYATLHYAYDEKYGYLTACPTNAGTGLRASYMVFLPALTAAGKIQRLCDEMGKFGVAMRGIYGEGTNSIGTIYQISNQKTMGNSEQEIIDSLNNIVFQVIRQERKRREYILGNHYDTFEDQVYRSYGVLKYARQISSSDAMTLLAQLKFGVDCGLIKLQEEFNLYSMMMNIQPANLQERMGKNIGGGQRDRCRAEYLNEFLPKLIQ